MGNNGSLMEKVYLYLPILLFHSQVDYENPKTRFNIRSIYFGEQLVLFAFYAYFVWVIKRKHDVRKILVPDVSTTQMFANALPPPEEMRYRRTTFFQHEMKEAFLQVQQNFVAMMLTVMGHFVLGIQPILLLQIFSAPYNFADNRLLRKHVLGLRAGTRVWGERFDGEVDAEMINEGDARPDLVQSVADASGVELKGDIKEAIEELDELGPGPAADVVEASEEMAQASEDAKAAEQEDDKVTQCATDRMPAELEDALIDAWEAGRDADWLAVEERLETQTVNTRTAAGQWTCLMVACGLPQVTKEQVEALVDGYEAAVHLQDQDGWTCAHWAAHHGGSHALEGVFAGLRARASEPTVAAEEAARLVSIRNDKGQVPSEVARDADLDEDVLARILSLLEENEEP